jgi:tetratricopeptide (TPR) repeat protein
MTFDDPDSDDRGKFPEGDPGVALPLDSLAGPAARINRQRLDSLVEGALAMADEKPPLVLRRRRRGIAAAALVLVAGSAAASLYVGTRPNAPLEAPAAAPKPAKPSHVSATTTLPSPAAPPEEPESPATDPEEPKAAEAAPAVERPAEVAKTPEDWLERANALRRRGRFAEAERAYAKVYDQYPGTLSAYVARVAAASIKMDYLGDPRGAQRLLEAARRGSPGGALDIEVREGLAESARRLGDTAGERGALEGLVSAYPKSRAAETAKKRLAEL